jgi:hypothetical protein
VSEAHRVLVSGFLAFLASTAVGAPQAGVTSYLVIGDCPAVPDFTVIQGPYGPQLCESVALLPPVPGETVAEEFTAFAPVANFGSSITLGSSLAGAVATFDGPVGMPVLGAVAASLDRYSAVFASVGATQLYSYSGSSPVSFPLDGLITFTGIASASYSFGQIGAEIMIVDMSFTPGPFGTVEGCGSPGVIARAAVPLGFASSFSIPFTLSSDCNGNPLTLSPGMQFGLITSLQVLAYREAIVDASSTFVIDIASSVSVADRVILGATLVPQLVPEPSLLGYSALVALLILRTRSQR